MDKLNVGKMTNNGFTVMIMNGKGGVGKSNIAFHLAHNFDFIGMDFDVKGNLSERLPKKIYHIDIETSLDDIEIPSETNAIIDMGGNDDHREIAIAESANLILIPYTPSTESVMTTATTLERIKHIKTPILFVATMVTKEKKATEEFYQQIEYLKSAIGEKEISHYIIHRREDYQAVTYADTPIMELLGAELDKHGNPVPLHFRKRRAMNTKKELKGLHDLIMQYK